MTSQRAQVSMVFPSVALDNEAVVQALAMDTELTESQARSGQSGSARGAIELRPMDTVCALTYLRCGTPMDDDCLKNVESALMASEMAFDRLPSCPDGSGSRAGWRPGLTETGPELSPDKRGRTLCRLSLFAKHRHTIRADAPVMTMD